jgi:hypothetical protein
MARLSLEERKRIERAARGLDGKTAFVVVRSVGGFAPLEMILRDVAGADTKRPGRISSANLKLVWEWMVEEAAASTSQDFLAEALKSVMEGKPVPRVIADEFQRQSGRAMHRLLNPSSGTVDPDLTRRFGVNGLADARDVATLMKIGPEVRDFVDSLSISSRLDPVTDATIKLQKVTEKSAPEAGPLLACVAMQVLAKPEQIIPIVQQMAGRDVVHDGPYAVLFDAIVDRGAEMDERYVEENALRTLDSARFRTSRGRAMFRALEPHVQPHQLEQLKARERSHNSQYIECCEAAREFAGRLISFSNDDAVGQLSPAESDAVLFVSHGQDVAEGLGIEVERMRALRTLDQALETIRAEVIAACTTDLVSQKDHKPRRRWWLAREVIALRHGTRMADRFYDLVTRATQKPSLQDMALAPLFPLTNEKTAPSVVRIDQETLGQIWDDLLVRADLAEVQVEFIDALSERDIARAVDCVVRARACLPFHIDAQLDAQGGVLSPAARADVMRIRPLFDCLPEIERFFQDGVSTLPVVDEALSETIAGFHAACAQKRPDIGSSALAYVASRLNAPGEIIPVITRFCGNHTGEAVRAAGFGGLVDAIIVLTQEALDIVPERDPLRLQVRDVCDAATLVSDLVEVFETALYVEPTDRWRKALNALTDKSAARFTSLCDRALETIRKATPTLTPNRVELRPDVTNVPHLETVHRATLYAQFLREARIVDHRCGFAARRAFVLQAVDRELKAFARHVRELPAEQFVHAPAHYKIVCEIIEAFQGRIVTTTRKTVTRAA